jgi:hypothetical protein
MPAGSFGWSRSCLERDGFSGADRKKVQQGSIATGLDAGGPWCALRDGDLRPCTPVDGLPLDGMQEVWGSNPHSYTKYQFRMQFLAI